MANETRAPSKAAEPEVKPKPQVEMVEVDCLANCSIHEGTYFDRKFKKGRVKVRRVDYEQILSRYTSTGPKGSALSALFGKEIHSVSE